MSEKKGAGNLLRILLLIVFVYVAWSEGWPYVQRELSHAKGPGSQCVSAAADVTYDFMGEMHHYIQKRDDRSGWHGEYRAWQEAMREASQLCRCDLDSCARGRRILQRLKRLMVTFDEAVVGDRTVANTEADSNELERMIREGRELARDGR